MACENCCSGLLFTVDSKDWALIRVVNGGFPTHMLGLQPIVPEFSQVLVVRYNVHYHVDFKKFEDRSLDYIVFTHLRENKPIEPCPHNTFTPDRDNLIDEQNRISNLGFDLG